MRPEPPHPPIIFDADLARLSQVETSEDLDLPLPLQETIRAVQQLSNGKAPGSDAIRAGVYKNCGPQPMDYLTALFQEMWRQGEVPQGFKDATIVHPYKKRKLQGLQQSPRHLLTEYRLENLRSHPPQTPE
nr:unnamed protein product [Spirometra erinaceieuropaei]